ncbi:MAG TPA: branched-chain amino acid ABC transporter permease [Thermodesulfobacteriota bacterium]|nr:branched-chain amino acid ABC transporter permease [Thermodesulfobacteriota bacterium]
MYLNLAIQTLVFSVLVAGFIATVASGISLVLGVTRIINFAHGELVMLGAYLTYWLYVLYGISPLVSAFISFIAMGVLSYIIFRLFLHRVLQAEGHNQLLATVGLSIVLQNIAMLLWTPNIKTINVQMLPTYKVGSIVIPGNFLFVAIMGMICYGVLIYIVNYTSYGTMMKMTSDHPQLAQYSGVDVFRAFSLSFVIGGAFAGAAGSMLGVFLYITPLVGLDASLKGFAVVIAGGIGSVPGAIVGALMVSMAEGFCSAFMPEGASWGFGVAFLIVILILLFRPTGILKGKELT